MLKEHLKFFDHHFYKEKDIKRLLLLKEKLKCDYIITTEKDIVRMETFYDFFLYPEVEMEIEEGFYKMLSYFIEQIDSR